VLIGTAKPITEHCPGVVIKEIQDVFPLQFGQSAIGGGYRICRALSSVEHSDFAEDFCRLQRRECDLFPVR
jgi:hypothetical protein